MFEWINTIIAEVAYGIAIESAGLASSNGMHEMEIPDELQEFVNSENAK